MKKNFLRFVTRYLISSVVIAIIIMTLNINIDRVNLIESKNYIPLQYTGCEGISMENGRYKTITNDPMIIFTVPKTSTNIFSVNIEAQNNDLEFVQLFYSEDGNFSEQNSIIKKVGIKENNINIIIPYGEYKSFRIDPGSKEGFEFTFNQAGIIEGKISTIALFIDNIEYNKMVILSILILIIQVIFKNRDTILKNISNGELGYVIFIGGFLFSWAVVQPFNYAPDEYMRYDIIKFIFDNNHLPIGTEPELINPIWGFSYAFLPYINGILSSLIMEVVNVFTDNENVLVIAARMSSVIWGMISTYYTIKVGKILFKKNIKWMFIITITLLPQFLFINSYMNNDSMALATSIMIVYYVLKGSRENWNNSSVVGLGVSTGLCVLSYYNAYVYIIFAVVMFLYSNSISGVNRKEIINKFLRISIIVIGVSGWWFLRSAILFDGDFLGLSTTRMYGEMYGIQEFKPSNRMTPMKMGYSLYDMLFGMGWIKHSIKSLIGCFGYMQYYLEKWMYVAYGLIIIVPIFFGMIVSIYDRAMKKKILKNEKNRNSIIVVLTLMLLIVILSIYNSYFGDFQPQGRYIITIIYPISYLVCSGIAKMKKEKWIDIGVICINTTVSIIAVVSYFSIFLPSCFT